MTALRSWADGYRRVFAAPAIVAGVVVATLVTALPLALTMRGLIEEHLGASQMADAAVDGVNYDWWQEFASQARGLGVTFTPSVVGFAATLDNVGSLLDGQREVAPVVTAIGAYLLAWLFLTGGILDRYARQRPTRAHGFFAACGVYFWRLLRLGVVAGGIYWWLFTYVHSWLFADWYVQATRDLAVEQTVFAWRAGLYAVFGSLLIAANIVFDFTKVRLVVEDRRSVIWALAAALGFIARHPGRVVTLYVANCAAFLVLLAVWAMAAPGVGGGGVSVWLGLLAGQTYVLARLVLKLQFAASEIALFQASLAHARYAGAPARVWPDSPGAEALTT